MGYSCYVPGCKSNYKKDEPSVTVFKFPGIGELRQKLLQNIHRKFDKMTQSTSDKSMYKILGRQRCAQF